MRGLFFVCVAISVGLGASHDARADDQAVVDSYLAPMGDRDERDRLRHMATCVAERHPDLARSFVLDAGDDVMLRANQENLIDGKCVKSYWFRTARTTVSTPFYAPELAEALLKLDFADRQLPTLAQSGALDQPALPDVPIDSVHPHYREMFILDKASYELRTATECAARSEPSLVMELAHTEPNSADQSQILAALEPVIAKCANYALRVTFPDFVKRGALVMNLYRLAYAAHSGANTAGAS